MKILKLLGFMTLGAVMMALMLAWIAQFFGPLEPGVPVIRLSTEAPPSDQQRAD
jgi:hypothetical protein